MNVKICSRKEIERFLNHDFPADTAVISFYDSDSAPRVNYQKKADSVLYVPLDDFQTELPQAKEIAKFIRTAEAKGLNIICQCESRVEKVKRGRKTAQKSRECKYVANKSHNTLLRCLRQ